ncbi:MAG: diguanylate cyclase, partial [Burkholderiales bacterium]|nr:diguanylate cyclase [Burkholderiales bacterium]
NRLSVRNRIRTIVVMLICGIVVGAVIDIFRLHEALWHEKEEKTRQLVETGASVLAHFHSLQQKGELSEAAAQAAAISTIRAMRYDETEYFWLSDLGSPFPKVIMHPTMPALDGHLLDLPQFNSATSLRVGNEGAFTVTDGKKNIGVAFVEVVNQGGQGYVVYDWQKPKVGAGVTERLYPKLSYVKKFAPWGWLIGSGVYVDDVDAVVRNQVGRDVLLVAGVGALLLLAATFIARSITQPLHKAVDHMRSLELGVSTSAQRMPVEGRSEISEMAAGFNDMLGHIEARDAQLARYRESLETAVAQRTVELHDTNAQLQQELNEHQRAERVIQENRIRMRALLDATSESVLLLDPRGQILAINTFGAARFGQVPEAIMGKNFYELLPPELATKRRALVEQVVTTGEPLHSQDRRGAIYFDNSIYPVKDAAGDVESIAVYAKDVTEQHSAKEVDDIFRNMDAVLLKWRMKLASIAQIFCDDILPVFDLAAAWIGRAEKDGQLTWLASAEGADKGFLNTLMSSGKRWDGDPACCLPTGEVLRSGQWQVVDSATVDCQNCIAVNHGIGTRAVIVLPLILRGEPWGVLTLYGRESHQFEGTHLPQRLAAIAVRLGVSLESALQQEWLTLLDAALASVDNAVLITDAHGSALWVNRALSKLSGYSSEDILGKTPKMFSSGHQDADFFQRFWQTIGSGRTWHGEIVNARPDGSTYTVNQTVTPLLEASGQVSHFVAILEDITQRKAAEARVQHNAQFDLLTDLPNRGLFLDRLAQALNLGERNGESAALLFLDLDHFKEVNDQLGHAAGDDLLIAVGVRLREQVRQSDTVARLGGDEFTVILPNLRDREDAVRVANGIIAAIGKPFDIAGTQVKVGITIGIALFPAHGDTVEQVLKAADDAMYQAKESGRNRYAFAAAPAEALTING